jgi:V/A-type H+-transporting ATPase subunit K
MVTQLISGIWQGKVAAASMQLIARKPKQTGQAIILPAMVETFAVFGLLVGILLLNLIV